MSQRDEFITIKINEIKDHFHDQEFDLFDLIGSVNDLFSSSYQTENIASKKVIDDLWDLLLEVFLNQNNYDNKTSALFAMSDILIYAKKHQIALELEQLKEWRETHDLDSSSEELIECIDDMLV